ncbi:MAG: hypothetical protein A3A73_00850 [Omnitrophica bacterium RIFCSPLOWO2_01_FULL_50_24]|nr:MAG: hypothetical protein A3A73_00850 [Omnitrophica bacterium RIFCSPLOWO2_01_FULL_50_24]
MDKEERIHNGVVGILVIIGAALAHYGNLLWLLALGILGALMIVSALTGYCPLYAALGKRKSS